MQDETLHFPLISVVITTFNYGIYLPVAIESVIKQSYPRFEILVIDDGSTDDTSSVIIDYPSVKYYYQANRGLSAARNTGILKSRGEYLVFLDADDWLEDNALYINAGQLKNRPELAFVSGNYFFLSPGNKQAKAVMAEVNDRHYEKLLESNYIGMHAAVMFQRWVIEEFHYNENLKTCEDYDLYLKIARKYPVYHHQKFIATYNFHEKGLSHNYEAMIDSIYTVIKEQAPFLKTTGEIKAYRIGINQWKIYHCLKCYKIYSNKKTFALFKNRTDLFIFIRYNPPLLWQLLKIKIKGLLSANFNKSNLIP